MASLDERVAYLEGRMEDDKALRTDLRDDVRSIRTEIGALRSDIRTEIDAVRAQIGAVRNDMDRRFERVDQKMDRQFMWLVGILVGVLLGLVGLAFQVARLQPA